MEIKSLKMPTWAVSMVSNYKRMFKDKYGRETTLSDDVIFSVTESIFDDEDNRVQDEARVEEMLEQEE